MPTSTLPVVYRPAGTIALPDNGQWENRFEIHSESSNRVYIIAQNKKKRHWGCSCMAYRRYRYCKHLEHLGLPTLEKPFEVKLMSHD